MSQQALQRALQAHIVNGDAVIAGLIDNDGVPAETRLKIYADAYRLRLIDALQANYPALAKLMGEGAFARLAQLYLSVHPSQHYSIRWFGHRLADFLREYPEYRDPRLTELAAFEWSIAAAFDAADAMPIAIESLATVAPESWPTLRFEFHPSVQRQSLTTNAVAVIKAVDDTIEIPESALSHTQWLIWRQQLTPQYRSLNALEAVALDAALQGKNFGVLCETLAEHMDADSVPLTAAGFLKQWIVDECIVALDLDSSADEHT